MVSRSLPKALDRNLVFDFFWQFAVFECALKRAGYLKKGRGDTAEPNWDKFGDTVRERLAQVSTPSFLAAVQQIANLSPRRQVVRGEELHWELVPRRNTDSDAEHALRLVRVARNNLFHGGKYPDGPIEEIARDNSILGAALAILEGCSSVDDEVKRWINQEA